MINTVIFDLDGLLIDSEVSFMEIYNSLLEKYNCFLSVDDYLQEFCGKKIEDNVGKIVKKYNLPISDKEVFDYVIKMEEERVKKGHPLKKGAKQLLDYLKNNNYKIVLATSSIKQRAITLLKNNGIFNYFDAMAFGSEIKNGKPFPDIFLKAAELANADTKNALVLEDSNLGIQAANNANIKVICIPDLIKPDQYHYDLCEKVLDSLEDVIEYLDAHNNII